MDDEIEISEVEAKKINQYIKDNLKVNLSTSEEFCNYTWSTYKTMKVSLVLQGEEICSDTETI